MPIGMALRYVSAPAASLALACFKPFFFLEVDIRYEHGEHQPCNK
jgi:hypothetical protein